MSGPGGGRPKLTVFTPTFNRPHYLERTMRSVLGQTFGEFEYLIRDNSRDDAVEKVVRSFDDPRIRYIRNEVNSGAAGNWLGAVNDASCDIVASIHDDDFWAPTFLERVAVPLIDDPTIRLGFSDLWMIDEDDRLLHSRTEAYTRSTGRHTIPAGRQQWTVEKTATMSIVDRAIATAVACAFRRDLAPTDGFPADIGPLYDLWLSYLLAIDGGAFWYEPERVSHYRLHTHQITASKGWDVEHMRCYGYFLADPRLNGIHHLLRPAVAQRRFEGACNMLKAGRREMALDELRLARPDLPRRRRPKAVAAMLPGSGAALREGAKLKLRAQSSPAVDRVLGVVRTRSFANNGSSAPTEPPVPAPTPVS
jgi:glycosyltransferase involved in cell wall biosynthesis